MLVEAVEDGVSVGYTDNYIYTYVNKELAVGDIVKVTLTEPYLEGMKAE